MLSSKNNPRILLFDIETTPVNAYVWQLWDTNVIKVVKDWNMLCFAYKWLGEKETHVVALPDFKARYKANKSDDLDVCVSLWKLLNEADIVIAHNGDAFDIKKANARFIMNGMPPPSSYVQIDTKKIAKKYFNFSSNSLKDLARYFGVKQKADAGGFGTWEGCMAGDKKAWEHMKEYNKQDVVVLEEVYLTMRPWMNRFPVTNNSLQCPKCASKKMQKRGFERTVTGIQYQRYHCQDCGGWSRSRLSEEDKPTLR